MLKLQKSMAPLSLAVVLAMGPFALNANAERTTAPNQSSLFASTLRDFYSLDAKARKKVFDVKNHQGESIHQSAPA
jgi:hypothetical protein